MKRDKRGRFAVKRKLMYAVLAITGAFGVQPFLPENDFTFTKEVPAGVAAVLAEAPGKTYEEKIEGVKKKIISDLAKCETGRLADPNGAIIFDSNDEASVGALQYQRGTVKIFVKKYEGKDYTNAEAITLAIEYDRASDLAEKILFTEKDGWKNWYNCGRKIGLAEKIAIIKEIEAQ